MREKLDPARHQTGISTVPIVPLRLTSAKLMLTQKFTKVAGNGLLSNNNSKLTKAKLSNKNFLSKLYLKLNLLLISKIFKGEKYVIIQKENLRDVSTQDEIPLGRSIRPQMFFKIGVLKIFANFTGKHLCWSLFLIKLQALKPANLLKRDSNTGVFL